MNLSTVKWAQWDKTQSRELLGLFICAQLLHTILHRTDLIIFPLTLQTITIASMMSISGKWVLDDRKDIWPVKRALNYYSRMLSFPIGGGSANAGIGPTQKIAVERCVCANALVDLKYTILEGLSAYGYSLNCYILVSDNTCKFVYKNTIYLTVGVRFESF